MPPCVDVYVWVEGQRLPEAVAEFIRRYVDVQDPGDVRLEAFSRIWIEGEVSAADVEAMEDLRRDPHSDHGFSLYVRARHHHSAIITVTEEGALVLGLSIDDPVNSSATLDQAVELLIHLRDEFAASAGVAGVEVPPPQSRVEWAQAQVLLRIEDTGQAGPVT